MECTGGVGSSYSYFITKHQNGRNLYVEMVRTDGSRQVFGPAVKK